MKFFTSSLFVFCGLILSQILSVYALPINETSNLEKRKIRPFEFLNSFIYFKKPSHWNNGIYAYIYDENQKYDVHWPGYEMRYNKNGFYYMAVENSHFMREYEFKVIFSDGINHQVPEAMQEGFPLRMDAVYDQTGIVGITNEKPLPMYYHGVDDLVYSNIARIYYRPKENVFDETIYIHYKIGNGEWNSVPGEEMTGMKGGFYRINIDLHDGEEITFTFTDGKNWDNNDGHDYKINKFGNFVIDKEGSGYL